MKMQNKGYKILFLIIFFSLFGLVQKSQADIYVSKNGLDSNPGTESQPKLTIQSGVNALKLQGPGNTLYLRGGVYTDFPINVEGTDRGIKIWTLNDAASWENSYTITSYPGEWAILDGSAYPSDHNIAALMGSMSDLGYQGFIEISRMEIRNFKSDYLASGIAMTGGPFRFRYLYIHDCGSPISNNLPAGIRLGNGTGDTTIEYCYFYRTGAPDHAENGGQVSIFSDYKYTSWPTVALHNAFGFATARHNNVIRYNYFDGGGTYSVGYYDKAAQHLAYSDTLNGAPVDEHGWYEEGNKIHHNIFVGHTLASMIVQSDFTQIYNNIADSTSGIGSSGEVSTIKVGMAGVVSFRTPTWRSCVYNNTVLGGYGSGITLEDDYNSGSATSYNQWWCYNNIIDAPTDYDEDQDLSINKHYSGTTTWDADNLVRVHNNYFYHSENINLVRVLRTDMTLTDLNAVAWAENNASHVHNSEDSLYAGTSGANQYELNSAYSDYTTVSAGGVNILHPYLSGVTIPSYIGAANPIDNNWVQGVLNLATVSNLQNAGSGDPEWIEDVVQNMAAPANPKGLSIS